MVRRPGDRVWLLRDGLRSAETIPSEPKSSRSRWDRELGQSNGRNSSRGFFRWRSESTNWFRRSDQKDELDRRTRTNRSKSSKSGSKNSKHGFAKLRKSHTPRPVKRRWGPTSPDRKQDGRAAISELRRRTSVTVTLQSGVQQLLPTKKSGACP